MLFRQQLLRFFLTAGLFLTASAGFAQAPDWMWARNPTGSHGFSNSAAHCVARDRDSNYYVAGRFNDSAITFGTTVLTNTGSGDVFLAKYNAAGTLLWARSATGAGHDEAVSVAVDTTGAAFITGIFHSSSLTFGTITISNSTGQSMFVAKYSPSGTPLWARTNTGLSETVGRAVAVDRTGACYVTGEILDNKVVTFGTVALSSIAASGDWDIFIVKYNASGTVVWAKRPGGGGDDQGLGITTDRFGNCFVTGALRSSAAYFGANTLTNNPTLLRMFTVKYNAAGNDVWARTSTAPGNDVGLVVQADQSGACYVGGVFSNPTVNFSGTILTKGTGAYSTLALKYDSSGLFQWAKSFGGGGPSNLVLNDMAIDTARNLYLTGAFDNVASFGPLSLTSAGMDDSYVLKLNDTGGVVWVRGIGSAVEREYANGIAVDPIGSPIVVGTFWCPSLVFGPDTLDNNNGSSPIFVARQGSCSVAPPQPAALTGPATLCAGSVATYSTTAVPGAFGYVWTLPGGWTGSSSGPSITATASGAAGTVSVAALNACGTGPARTFTVASVVALPTPTITQSGNMLSTTSSFATYQWYFNGSPIGGATGQNYTPAQSGSYYVVVTNNSNCSGQSAAASVTLGIGEPGTLDGLVLYPNPVRDAVRLRLPPGGARITIANAVGRLMHTADVPSGSREVTIAAADWPAGIYLLTYEGVAGRTTVKLVKE